MIFFMRSRLFERRKDSIREYSQILDEFSKNYNYQQFGARIRLWSMTNNRDPKLVYYYQMKAFKGK